MRLMGRKCDADDIRKSLASCDIMRSSMIIKIIRFIKVIKVTNEMWRGGECS